jgi:crotonobetainyl-CoA:carnitine CoA-transferase CaiB-like acyl-CoA transferase
MVLKLDQPGARSDVRLLGVPVKLSRTPGAPAGPGPALGEHTREVLSSLGYSDNEIVSLLESGAARGPASEAAGAEAARTSARRPSD